ncbi:cation:proton antiporter [Gracilimonas mengyeensis]|uniref:Transporter, CPA2 family n=1 Tax=Gracilimonas mengyeensis TaxID=1302730 RepID=A0A521BWS9_9BACT|nr:cation:proton antiporter [Gracilimonas mengyeensis]SMO51652.1 transporter, CPA2 family [Gracilimonas mengyeensis]
MDVFSAAPHHDVLVLVVQIGVLLLVARALGEIAQRLNQPSVVGEIMAGILLGPSLLAGFFPELGEWVVPQNQTQGYLLEVVSLIGAMFLLLITGLETDIRLIKRHARTAMGVSWGGIIITFATGFVLGQFLPDYLLADSSQRLVFSLFVATALSISAIPVIAKVLMDLNLMRRDIGQTIIAAGMSDDTTGWILLSIVAGLASGEAVTAGTVLQIVGSVLAFMVVSFTIGRWMVKKLLTYVQDEVQSTDRLLTLVVVLTFLWGAITQALNLEAVLGAFVMGIIFGMMPRLPDEVHHKLESIALGIFAPIFFAVAGLKVNVINLFEPHLLLITGLVILVATGGKVVGTYIGARFIGKKDHWTALSFGAGLNARGAMEIIIATIGLRLGILSQDMFSIIVVMAMATSLMAPSAMKWVLSNVKIGKEEEERLKKEEMEAESMVAGIHRVLLPVRKRGAHPDKLSIQSVESQLLALMGKDTDLSVTLMTVVEKDQKKESEQYLDELGAIFKGLDVTTKLVTGEKPDKAIINEAQKDYDLLILGATEPSPERSHLFSSFIDYVVRVAPCPVMVVQSEGITESWKPRRILVPTTGTQASRNAAELGFALARNSESCEVTGLNVVEQGRDSGRPYRVAKPSVKKSNVGASIVKEFKERGEAYKITTEGIVEHGEEVESIVLDFVEKNDIDLMILGTNIRPGSHRLYLGPRVENILEQAKCPVVVFNT